jgi:hypothetical protein
MNLLRPFRPSVLASAVLAVTLTGALVVTAGVGVATAGVQTRRAGTCVRKGDAAGITVNAKTINAKLIAMRQANRSEADIERVLANDWCLTKISTAPFSALDATSPGNVVWKHLTISYDNDTKWYYANGEWSWNTSNYHKEVSLGCQLGGKGDGGKEGVGLRLTGGEYQIKPGGFDATAWGNPADNKYVNDYGAWGMTQSTGSESGIGFIGQDSVRKMENSKKLCPGAYDLSTYGGSIVMAFKRLNGSCANTQLWGDYVHTWSHTSVNSIGAQPWGFSIGWSKEGDNWPKESAGETARTC